MAINNTKLYDNIRQAIQQARQKVSATVNIAMIEAIGI